MFKSYQVPFVVTLKRVGDLFRPIYYFFFFFFNVTGFRVTSSSSQFSSRDSAQFSDSGSADEVDEFEIQGMN